MIHDGRDETTKSRKNQNNPVKGKHTNTWEYWKRTLSNEWRSKKKMEKKSI